MKTKIILIIAVVLLVAGAAGATWWFTRPVPEAAVAEGDQAPAPAEVEKPLYIALEPNFVVNLQNERSMRFLMVEVQLMTRKESVITAIEEFEPRLRHELIMLFSKQTRDAVSSAESRDALISETLDTVNRVLTEERGKGGVDAVYFTKFVMQ